MNYLVGCLGWATGHSNGVKKISSRRFLRKEIQTVSADSYVGNVNGKLSPSPHQYCSIQFCFCQGFCFHFAFIYLKFRISSNFPLNRVPPLGAEGGFSASADAAILHLYFPWLLHDGSAAPPAEDVPNHTAL